MQCGHWLTTHDPANQRDLHMKHEAHRGEDVQLYVCLAQADPTGGACAEAAPRHSCMAEAAPRRDCTCCHAEPAGSPTSTPDNRTSPTLGWCRQKKSDTQPLIKPAMNAHSTAATQPTGWHCCVWAPRTVTPTPFNNTPTSYPAFSTGHAHEAWCRLSMAHHSRVPNQTGRMHQTCV